MTAPNLEIDIIMPYAVEYKMDAAVTKNYMTLMEPPASGLAYRHYLEPGTYDVQLCYSGPEAASLRFRQATDVPMRTTDIPAGTAATTRNSQLMTVQARTGSYLEIATTPSPESALATSTASIKVFPVPRYTPNA